MKRMSMNFGLDSNNIRRSNFGYSVAPTPSLAPVGINSQPKVSGSGFGNSMFHRINVKTTGGGGCGCGK